MALRYKVSYSQRQDAELKSFAKAAKDAVAWHEKRGLPVAKFDETRGVAYLEYADGRKEYVAAP